MIALVKRILFADWLVGYLMIIGLLTTPFFQTDSWRSTVLGTLPAQPTAAIAVLCLALALAWRSLLRRDFVWLGPARLTWDDFDGSRVRTMNLRMLGGWVVRFLAVAYVSSVAAQVHGWSMDLIPVGCALLGATALVALGMARRLPRYRGDIWFEQVVPLLLAALALVPLPVWWRVAAVGAVLGGIAFAPGPRVARSAGRADLLEGWQARMLRQVSVSFLDVLALLPPAHPVRLPKSLSGRFVVVRFVLVGALARIRYLTLTGLLALAVVMLPRALPAAGAVWWIGLGAFFAAIPYAGSLGELSRVPGLRRWLGCTDLELRITTAGLMLVITVLWWAVTGFAFGWTVPGLLVSVLAAGAVVRTVTRPMLDFNKLGEVAVPGQADMPIGLVGQLLRGVDVLLVGAGVLTFFPSAVIGVPVVAGLFAFSVWREVST